MSDRGASITLLATLPETPYNSPTGPVHHRGGSPQIIFKHMAELASETIRQNPNFGIASLSPEERAILYWDNARTVSEVQRANPGVEPEVVKEKLLRIDQICIVNGGITDAFRMLGPETGWEKIRDLYVNNEPVDGMVSTYHNLGRINYPEGFWKAIIEREREKLN